MKIATSLLCVTAAAVTTLFANEALAIPTQCVEAGDRADFESALTTALEQSPLSVNELYDHASNRLGYGWAGSFPETPTHAELAALITDSLEGATDLAAVEQLDATLAPKPNNWSQYPYESLPLSLTEAWQLYMDPAGSNGQTRQVVRAHMRWAAGRRATAQALSAPNIAIGHVLGEFWFNHFNVQSDKTRWATARYQDALRETQCGSFEELLVTSAQSPAMLIYLDNRHSEVGSINENYGRELLELHTLGDDTNTYYNQADVVAASRALTGWSVRLNNAGVRFNFVPTAHDPAALSLFGGALNLAAGTGAATDVFRGEELLAHLAAHPATQENICQKLTQRLAGRESAGLRQTCEAAWQGSQGDLASVVQAILLDADMWTRNKYRTQVKSPFELVVSGQRAYRTPLSGNNFNNNFLQRAYLLISRMGQPVGNVPPPTGYPDSHRGWASAALTLAWHAYTFSDFSAPAALASSFAGMDASTPSTEIDAAVNELKTQLGLPPDFPVPVAALREAVRNGDIRTDESIEPTRTAIDGVFGSIRFMRK